MTSLEFHVRKVPRSFWLLHLSPHISGTSKTSITNTNPSLKVSLWFSVTYQLGHQASGELPNLTLQSVNTDKAELLRVTKNLQAESFKADRIVPYYLRTVSIN